jgi:type II secretory pathway component PulF
VVLAQADFHICAIAVGENGGGIERCRQRFVEYLPGSVKGRELAKLDQAIEYPVAYMNWI